MPKTQESYYDVISAAVNDLSEHGYDSPERVAYWVMRIKDAAERTLGPPTNMERMLREQLGLAYKRLIERGQIAQYHVGISRFTIDRVRPQLRAELDRRILASASLIRLNRESAIQNTLKRFQGWSTSIPKGGQAEPDKRKEKDSIRKPMASLKFEQRRLLIDQAHKLRSALSDILATDGGAIAATWHSHFRQPGYDYRPDHKELDGKIFAIRGSWAITKGLMRRGPNGYTDTEVAPAEKPFCRCFYTYIYALRDLPSEMITTKGEAALMEAKAKLDSLRRVA